jgi:hypothetical protein
MARTLLPRQVIEIDVAAADDDADAPSRDRQASLSRQASGTADDGSMTIFMRSHVMRMAEAMAASLAVGIAVTWRRIACSVRSESVARRPSAIVSGCGSGSTLPEANPRDASSAPAGSAP